MRKFDFKRQNAKTRGAIALAGAISLLLVAGCSSGTPDQGADQGSEQNPEAVNLIMASYQPPGSAWKASYERWAEEVETATEGRVTIELHDNESLLSQADIMTGVASGRADIGFFINSFHPAELPLSSVVELPFITHDGQAQVAAFNELYDSYDALRDEYHTQGIEVASFLPSTPSTMSTREPFSSPEDLAGTEVRGIGYVSKALEILGAQPATLALGEIYEGLDRGVIDANVTVFENTHTLGLHEVAPHVTDIGTGGFTIALLGFNKSLWEDRLTPEDQETIRNLARDSALWTLDEFDAMGEAACQAAIDGGGTATVWDEQAVSDWKDSAYDDLVQEWQETAGVNAPAEEFFDLYLETLEEQEALSDYEPSIQVCANSNS